MVKHVSKLYHNAPRHIYAAVFSAIELTFILLILFSSLPNIVVCYSAICAAFLFALPFLAEHLKENSLILSALFFTLIADFFLVIKNGLHEQYIYKCLGVSAFIVVQFFYFLYLYSINTKSGFLLRFIIRLGLSVLIAVVSVIVLKDSSNYLSVISTVYFLWLLMNIAVAAFNFKKTRLFFIGLIFFAFCDIIIGLKEASKGFFDIPKGFIHDIIFQPFDTAWLCYGIAQTLIVLHLILKPVRSR